jgi:hypothetical protein
MYVNILSIIKNHIDVGMVSMFDFSVVELWFYPQYMDIRSFGPYNIFWVTDRSIYCHMTLSAMNYLLYNELISKGK